MFNPIFVHAYITNQYQINEVGGYYAVETNPKRTLNFHLNQIMCSGGEREREKKTKKNRS